jgi:hypothetical protein
MSATNLFKYILSKVKDYPCLHKKGMPLDGDEESTSSSSHFTLGKQPQYPLNRKTGWTHGKFVHFIEDKLSRVQNLCAVKSGHALQAEHSNASAIKEQ